MKVTALLDRLIAEVKREAARPESQQIRERLCGGVDALLVFHALLTGCFPDSLLLPDDEADSFPTQIDPATR